MHDTSTIDKYEMSPQRRELFLRVINDYAEFHVITNRLYFLDQHFPPHQVDRALAWLILSGTIGRKFVTWFSDECHNSDLEMHRTLLAIIANKDKERLIAGRNFKT